MTPDHITRAMRDIVRDFRDGNRNSVVSLKLCRDGAFQAEVWNAIGRGVTAVEAIESLRAELQANAAVDRD